MRGSLVVRFGAAAALAVIAVNGFIAPRQAATPRASASHPGRQVEDGGGLGRGKPCTAQLPLRDRQHRLRRRVPVEQRFEAAVDRGCRLPRQLLVRDRPSERAEVVAAFVAAALQLRRPGNPDELGDDRVPVG